MFGTWSLVAGWYHALVVASLPWIVLWRPYLVPLAVAVLVVLYPVAWRERRVEPWPSLTVALSCSVALAVSGGLRVLLGWLVLACVTGALVYFAPRPRGGRPDLLDGAMLVAWATAIGVRPELIERAHGGWLAPLVLLLAVRRAVSARPRLQGGTRLDPFPPSRSIRGTLSLRDAVLADEDRTPRSIPLDLELRAGRSLAILCDEPRERHLLADLLAGRRAPASGELAVDGSAIGQEERLVAVVAPGERFLAGNLETNLGALCDEQPERITLKAVSEACSLEEVEDALDDRPIARTGEPLEPLHRMLVLAARVIPSSYHILVVVDPMAWVSPVRGELWRSAVVRASIGRTAVWLTADRDLASRADQVLSFRHGGLRDPGT